MNINWEQEGLAFAAEIPAEELTAAPARYNRKVDLAAALTEHNPDLGELHGMTVRVGPNTIGNGERQGAVIPRLWIDVDGEQESISLIAAQGHLEEETITFDGVNVFEPGDRVPGQGPNQAQRQTARLLTPVAKAFLRDFAEDPTRPEQLAAAVRARQSRNTGMIATNSTGTSSGAEEEHIPFRSNREVQPEA